MTESGRIATNLRTLRILEILGNADQPMTPTQINLELGLPKQTIHRLCKTLVEEGYLTTDGRSKGLRPSRRLRSLASGILFASQFHIGRHQILEDIASQVSETVNFVIPQAEGMIYMDRVETDWAFRIQLPIGSHVPFHCTASGKTFLASLAPKTRTNMVDSLPLNKLTENTLVDKEKLLDELALVRKRGYALDNEEFMDGMIAMAVPVRDSDRRYVGALAFHGPIQRVALEDAISKKDILVEGAARLSISLSE